MLLPPPRMQLSAVAARVKRRFGSQENETISWYSRRRQVLSLVKTLRVQSFPTKCLEATVLANWANFQTNIAHENSEPPLELLFPAVEYVEILQDAMDIFAVGGAVYQRYDSWGSQAFCKYVEYIPSPSTLRSFIKPQSLCLTLPRNERDDPPIFDNDPSEFDETRIPTNLCEAFRGLLRTFDSKISYSIHNIPDHDLQEIALVPRQYTLHLSSPHSSLRDSVEPCPYIVFRAKTYLAMSSVISKLEPDADDQKGDSDLSLASWTIIGDQHLFEAHTQPLNQWSAMVSLALEDETFTSPLPLAEEMEDGLRVGRIMFKSPGHSVACPVSHRG